MAKNPSKAPTSARQAKIQAAQKQTGGGANKIVVATVVKSYYDRGRDGEAT